MAAELLTEESALELADLLTIHDGIDPVDIAPLVKPIATALLRTQKIAYLLGQIAAMDECAKVNCPLCSRGFVSIVDDKDWFHHQDSLGRPAGCSAKREQSRLRELRAELLEQK
jgi:hypothetical protein